MYESRGELELDELLDALLHEERDRRDRVERDMRGACGEGERYGEERVFGSGVSDCIEDIVDERRCTVKVARELR